MQETKCLKCGDSGFIIKLPVHAMHGASVRKTEIEECDCPGAVQKREKLINLKRKGVFV